MRLPKRRYREGTTKRFNSVDYLTVNVWTPHDRSRPRPVLVFVHGGGFVAGSGRPPVLDADSFIRDGVVVVTLNYRLGIAGWLDVPGAPPNRGRTFRHRFSWRSACGVPKTRSPH